MQTKRIKFPRTFFASVFILSLAACAPIQPADPAYQWASGNWTGKTSRGQPADAQLRVINGNQLTGYVNYHSTSGRIAEGRIKSGFVGKKGNVSIVQGEVDWGSGDTTKLDLRLEEGVLRGWFSNIKVVKLRKAK